MVAAEYEKSESERVVVQRKEYKGKDYVDARVHYLAGTDDWRPTKKGLCLSPELARQVAEAMIEAAAKGVADATRR